MGNYLKLFENHSGYTAFTQTEEFVKPNVSHCIQENEVHYNPFINSNGHDYVDLGLPSGTLWAACNVGATSEEELGLYFAWGETDGYSGVGQGREFSGAEYKLASGYTTTEENLIKYCNDSGCGYNGFTDNLTILELEDDAARVNMGGSWTMPTREMCEEMIANTTFSIAEVNSVKGAMFTSNNGNHIFLPFGGVILNNSLNYDDSEGNYWLSSLGNQAKAFKLETWDYGNNSIGNRVSDLSYDRFDGLLVRGVIKV